MRTFHRLGLLGCLALAVLSAACVSPRDKSKQLERVAKDWSLTIRAAQVIPVYPLTRDIWPGDVFLTTTPIGEEVALFEERGFLPMDVHLVRLGVDEAVQRFYATRLGEESDFPTSVSEWDDLPASAFPTYSFEISRGGGLNLAIPVQGVPVGLNYLGSSAATGTVTLKLSQTVGLDVSTLKPLLDAWAEQNQDLLLAYAVDPWDEEAQPVFVRVVTRVYRSGAVTVQLNDASSGGAQLAAGIELPTPEPGTPEATRSAAEQYQDVAQQLNTSLIPEFGGKLRVINASRRSVFFEEEFEAPMAIGYLAFDCMILPGGTLSAPMPTVQRLTGMPIADPGVFDSAGLVLAWYTADEPTRVPLIREWLGEHAGDAEGNVPSVVEFLSAEEWDSARRRMIRDLGIVGGSTR